MQGRHNRLADMFNRLHHIAQMRVLRGEIKFTNIRTRNEGATSRRQNNRLNGGIGINLCKGLQQLRAHSHTRCINRRMINHNKRQRPVLFDHNTLTSLTHIRPLRLTLVPMTGD